jgi:predicted hydrocarbon binding protein
MKSLKLKGLEYTNGVIRLFEERVVLFPPSIIGLLSSIYGEGAEPLLVFLGKKLGRSMIEKWDFELKPKSIKEITEIFSDLFSTTGWGQMVARDVGDDQIIFQLMHNVSKTLEIPSKFIDFFITGYITGFAEYIFYKAKVQETLCMIDDENLDFCQWVVNKLPT